jgi:serine/threonine protein kinase
VFLNLLSDRGVAANIVTMLGFCVKGDTVCMVEELMTGGDLRKIRDGMTVSFQTKLNLVRNICRGMTHLHARGVVHRE